MTSREADCDDDVMYQPTAARPATVYLALGTNLGDREASLREAARRIAWLGLTITRRSSIYETEPVGFSDFCALRCLSNLEEFTWVNCEDS